MCSHAAPHTATAAYDDDFGSLRFALVCDGCGEERRELGTMRHRVEARPYVNGLAPRLAHELGLPDELVERVSLAALVRDIGNQLLPPGILDKAGPLSPPEWEQVRRSPELGAGMIGGTALDDVSGWVFHHHERWDGRGYPHGLRGGEIPLEARILSVVDAYEAMTSERPYRAPMTHDEALKELWTQSGAQFDPAVVVAFGRVYAADGGNGLRSPVRMPSSMIAR
jgi:HD-GYP domain-containing protein (c-di-GMP phosphodiesterase class II)